MMFYKEIYLLLIVSIAWGLSGCQKDRTILPDLGIVVTNDPNDAGGGSFIFNYEYLSGRPIKVWFYSPHDNPKDATVVFVMHGVERNGDTYRNHWVNLARENNWLIVAPEFSNTSATYPGSNWYNLGNMFNGSVLKPEEQWTFSIIEPLFDHVVWLIDGNQTTYNIYGHSAGSQFVSRFLMLKEDLRVNRAVCANAGWYTMLDMDVNYPYGVRNVPMSKQQIERVLGRRVVVLLGEADTQRDSNLNTDPESDQQGPHRFARGQYFYNHLSQLAKSRDVQFNWTLSTVPGVGHNSRLMSPAAAELLRN